MKNLTLLFLFLASFGMHTILEGQINVLSTKEFMIEAKINLVDNHLGEIKTNSAAKIELHNGELDIIFPLAKNTDQQFYKISFEISLDNTPLSPLREDLKGFFGENIVLLKDDLKRITWMRLVDTYKQLDGLLQVKIKIELKGNSGFDCSTPPTFTKKQKRPYLIAGGVGIAALGAGQLFEKRKDKSYDEYLNSESEAEAQPKYDEANFAHKAHQILTYTGAAIVATDLVLYLIRNGKYKKNLKEFKKYCNDSSITVRPLIEIPNGSLGNSSSGVKLTFTF